jgi:glycerate kinase
MVAGIPSEILVAPDSFKGTFTAAEVAFAIGRGLAGRGRPVSLCPLADGGEGTLAALTSALGLELCATTVHDPLGWPVEASFGLAGRVAVLETAAASGLGLVAEAERDPLAASTYGTGELIAAALEAGARTVYIGVGGSATTDGGAGAIEALLAAGGIGDARLVVLCDVRTPFESAARVFAPQKGANARQVRALTARLQRMAARLGRDPRGLTFTGAAGGLAGGLWAAFEAELIAGGAFVLDAVGFDERMRAARAVITGEGRIDRQSLAGKLVSEVATRARQNGVPCSAVVGRRELDSFDQRILDLQVIIEGGTLDALEAAGAELSDLL